MRLGIEVLRRGVVPRTCVLLALGVLTAAPAQAGRVTGQVVDEAGKPVSGVSLRFASLEEGGASAVVEAHKKGRFIEAGLPGGSYRVTLVDSELFVASVAFDVRRGDGLSMGSGTIEGHPRDGAAGIPVSRVNDVSLTVTVAPKPSALGDAALTIATPELSSAVKLYNKTKFQEAFDEAARVLAENPDSAEALYVQGLAAEKLGRSAEAESALQRAAGDLPDFPGIWAALGDVALNLAADHEANGRNDEARETYARAADALSQAVERDPETMSLQVDLSVALDRSEQRERLVPVLERILERDPAHLQSRLRLAALYSTAGRHEEAVALLDRVPATEKRAAVTIYNVAVGLNDAGDVDGALAAARRSAEIDPELSYPKRLVAQILLGKGDHPAAIEAIRAFLEIAPDDPEADAYRRILQQLEGS